MSRSYTSMHRVARRLGWIVLACLVIQSAAAPPRLSAAGATRASATVRGVVWDSDNSPIPNASVRLRNLQSGRVESNAVTTERGEFIFSAVEGGSYAVELVDAGGKVIAVGQSFRIETGEAVATFVRLAPRRPWFAGVFSNTAAAVIAAASSVGLTAIGSQSRPVSPQ